MQCSGGGAAAAYLATEHKFLSSVAFCDAERDDEKKEGVTSCRYYSRYGLTVQMRLRHVVKSMAAL